jgi:hypothetical protein
MAQDIQGALKYYSDLLLYQYINQPKAVATIQALTTAAICDLVALDVNEGFNVETALGPQLDMIGAIVGRSRIIYVQLVGNYFRWQRYQDTPGYCSDGTTPTHGFTSYTDPTQNANSQMFWYAFLGGSTIALHDDEYRFFIKLQIALNSIDNTALSINNFLAEHFESNIELVDNLNMSITYQVSSQLSAWGQDAVSQNMLPKPAGVSVSVTVV